MRKPTLPVQPELFKIPKKSTQRPKVQKTLPNKTSLTAVSKDYLKEQNKFVGRTFAIINLISRGVCARKERDAASYSWKHERDWLAKHEFEKDFHYAKRQLQIIVNKLKKLGIKDAYAIIEEYQFRNTPLENITNRLRAQIKDEMATNEEVKSFVNKKLKEYRLRYAKQPELFEQEKGYGGFFSLFEDEKFAEAEQNLRILLRLVFDLKKQFNMDYGIWIAGHKIA